MKILDSLSHFTFISMSFFLVKGYQYIKLKKAYAKRSFLIREGMKKLLFYAIEKCTLLHKITSRYDIKRLIEILMNKTDFGIGYTRYQ